MDALVEDYEHPDDLIQETPLVVTSLWSSGLSFIQSNGWLILGLCLAIYYFWNKIQSSVKNNVESVLLGKSKKVDGPDGDEKLRLVRERMQKELEKKAELYKEKQKQKLEEERKKKLEEIDGKNDPGNKLNEDPKKKNTLFKSDYNPLNGSGPSGTYRAPKRSACSKGGCGGK